MSHHGVAVSISCRVALWGHTHLVQSFSHDAIFALPSNQVLPVVVVERKTVVTPVYMLMSVIITGESVLAVELLPVPVIMS